MSRPKGTTKYNTNQERKAARISLKSRCFRLVIPNLEAYKDQPDQLNKLKGDTLLLLLKKQQHLQHYKIAVQTHPTTGVPHLDILLLYSQSVLKSLIRFDYLIKHGHLTRYKKLNAAILDYGDKQDKHVLSNLPDDTSSILQLNRLKKDPYSYLQQQMLKDPLHFNLEQYVRLHNLDPHISSWSSLKTKLKDMQAAAANLKLKQKQGFKYIDRALIEANLNSQELTLYYSWSGYQTIVNYLNQIPTYGYERPFKSKQLFLTGRPNIGKTSLVRQIQKHCAIYHLDVSNWFPNYRDNVYTCILWDQFKLKRGMSHTDLLKFLQGSPMDLQYKGGSSLRRNNQLIIMTSNMTLQQHICFKFKDQEQRQLARSNLGTRIQQISVPKNLKLFLLLKLLVAAI